MRPTGVVLIAVYHFLAALMLAMVGVSLFAGGKIFATMMGGAESGVFAGLGLLVGVVGAIFFLTFALLYAVAGWGIWAMREWGRILSIVMAVVSLLFSLPGLLLMAMSMNMLLGGYRVLRIGISVLIIWYLTQPAIKTAFRSS
ncbi:MAG TPA: hypothetical protein VIH91_05100 [Terriglobales bacterium]